MANAVMTQEEGFTLEVFKQLYANSSVQEHLSADDAATVEKAIAENDLSLLHDVYDLLVANKVTSARDNQDFMAQKNKIMDSFTIEAKNIENSYVNVPRRKLAESATEREQREAENILKNL
jgi:hypothetical protein